MRKEELKKILRNHELWIKNTGGERAKLNYADLSDSDLSDADLSCANLSDANLSGANLSRANLRNANFKWANLSDANLRNANFRWANLSGADLSGADLSGANFRWADLSGADLSGADLNDADLRWANLSDANLSGAKLEWTSTEGLKGQNVISVQVNTSQPNNKISYWVDLDIWTTGCFQGTLEELRESIEKTHKDNKFLYDRYQRAIDYILEEVKFDEEEKG